MTAGEALVPRAEERTKATAGIGMWTFSHGKVVVDFLLALVILVLLLPSLLVIAALVRLTSRGPIFYLQDRVGRNGRVFRMLKFRTMVRNAEVHTGPVWARRDDPRVTRFGGFLRTYHLDELPQLLNVLAGHMSIVGPRPERPVFVRVFDGSIPRYGRRHSVRPGITGLAQVLHRYDESLDDVRKKLALDLLYIRRMCWLVDLMILRLTVGRVLRGEVR